MAVNLIWCYFACILCYAKEPGTEGFRGLWAEVLDAFCKNLSWVTGKNPQEFPLVTVTPLLHFYTIPLYWAGAFLKHSQQGAKTHAQSSGRAEPCSPVDSGRSWQLWLTQPACMLSCWATERILICFNRMGVRQAVSPASVNHRSPPEINAIMPIFIDP